MSEPLSTVPVFDPARALGWRDIGLDGLSCFLRCVEAVLQARGYLPGQVAQALAQPLELIRPEPTGEPFGAFPGCTVRWHVAAEGEHHWEWVRRSVETGVPLVVCPDGYWWPGDGFAGVLHAYHHMVLPVRFHDGVLEMLDTDAPRQSGYLRRITVDDATVRAFNRVATIEAPEPPALAPASTVARQLLPGSARQLRADIAQFDGFLARWRGGPIPALVAHGLHVMVLGDIQPQLFLLGEAIRSEPSEQLRQVIAGLGAAATHAKKLGLLLTGLHRFHSDDVYAICHAELVNLRDGLVAVLASLSRYLDEPVERWEPVDPVRFGARLAATTRWCFGQPEPETMAWLESLDAARVPDAAGA